MCSGNDYNNSCLAKCKGIKVQCKGECPCEKPVCVCPRIIDPVCGTDGKDNLIRIESFHLYVQGMSMTTNVWQNVKELKFSVRENVLARNHVYKLWISNQFVELTVRLYDKQYVEVILLLRKILRQSFTCRV